MPLYPSLLRTLFVLQRTHHLPTSTERGILPRSSHWCGRATSATTMGTPSRVPLLGYSFPSHPMEKPQKRPFVTRKQLGWFLMPVPFFVFAGGGMQGAGGMVALFAWVIGAAYLIATAKPVERQPESAYQKAIRWIGTGLGYAFWLFILASFNDLV